MGCCRTFNLRSDTGHKSTSGLQRSTADGVVQGLVQRYAPSRGEMPNRPVCGSNWVMLIFRLGANAPGTVFPRLMGREAILKLNGHAPRILVHKETSKERHTYSPWPTLLCRYLSIHKLLSAFLIHAATRVYLGVSAPTVKPPGLLKEVKIQLLTPCCQPVLAVASGRG